MHWSYFFYARRCAPIVRPSAPQRYGHRLGILRRTLGHYCAMLSSANEGRIEQYLHGETQENAEVWRRTLRGNGRELPDRYHISRARRLPPERRGLDGWTASLFHCRRSGLHHSRAEVVLPHPRKPAGNLAFALFEFASGVTLGAMSSWGAPDLVGYFASAPADPEDPWGIGAWIGWSSQVWAPILIAALGGAILITAYVKSQNDAN